ncbi:PfkB family carbohydrate kinase [Actinophytocola sediminis]
MTSTVVVGQITRDLVLSVAELPGARQSARVLRRREGLGGKGANIAVALAQLGLPVSLLGVVGDDHVAANLLARARRDGVDVDQVVRRPGALTGLVVDIPDAHGDWHYLEHLPPEILLTEQDVEAAAPALRAARCVVVQLGQPAEVALAAATCAKDAGRLVVLDGAPEAGDLCPALLATADVVRADAGQARQLTGIDIDDADSAVRAGRELIDRHGVALVAFGVPGGDAFTWSTGSRVVPYLAARVVDTSGAGDALCAALTSVLCRGGPAEEAVDLAVAAAAATVEHPGGRPNLTPRRLRRFLVAVG